MKIADYHTFTAMPPGTLFSYFEPDTCRGLYQKGATIHDEEGSAIDYFETSLVPVCWNCDPPVIEEVSTRWGEFDHGQLYAVLEADDLQTLMNILSCASTPAP